MGLELLTEAHDTKSARTFTLDFSTSQTVSDATSRFLVFLLYQPKQTKMASNMTEARRHKKQDGPPTRRDMYSIMTADYQKLKRNKEGYQKNLFLYQTGLCISLKKKRGLRKPTTAWDYQSPSTTLLKGSVQHTCTLGCICLKEREFWELAHISTLYPVREKFLEKA